MIRIGILGCGRIGRVHARSVELLRGAELVAVADALPQASEELAAHHGVSARSAEELIASDDIDAVVIGTPTTVHYDQIHAAAAAGKAIFCEKPVDLSSARVHECIAAVETAGVPFLTAFQRRFDPHIADLEARIREGEIGKVELIILTSRDPAPPPISYIETSGGIFRDMMIHDLDVARFLLGEEPSEVYATGSCLVDSAIEEAGDIDTASVTLRTETGKICMISCSRRATYGYDQRIEVHGSEGMLNMRNVHDTQIELAGAQGFRRAPVRNFFLERYEDAYFREMTYFVETLLAGDALRPNIQDGLQAQLLADAAAESLVSKMPVHIS